MTQFLKTRQTGPGRTRQVANLCATDRCDRCPARARVVIVIKGMDLLLCAHHFTAGRPRLIEQDAQIYGEE